MLTRLPKQLRKVTDQALLKDIDTRLEVVESLMVSAVKNTDSLAHATSNHLMRAGGKRMRPVLVLLTSLLGDKTKPGINEAAVVMELTHLGTLYHDDVMDEAPMRRGVPTAHSVWGNNTAILTGDLLFARASQLVSGLGERALRMQAETFEQLVLGQLHETVGPQDEDAKEHYIQVLKDKTGSLIALSAQLGALLSEASDSFQEPLRLFGERVGVAFQLMDDYIDIMSDDDDSGKTPGTDLRAGVPTLPLIMLRARSDEASQELVRLVDTGLESDTDLELAVAKLRENSVMENTLHAAVDWANSAKQALEGLPSGTVRNALEAFADAVVERKG